MKSAIKATVYPACGLLVFVLALAIILAAKGKLSAQALQRLPLVGAPERHAEEETGEAVPTVATMRYFSSEELSDMLREARALKQRTEDGAARLLERERRVQIYLKDLQKEKEELLKMRSEVEARCEKLRETERALAARMTEVKSVEVAGLRRSALIHESMDPKRAAAAIAALDREQAAKLLSFIQEKKAARILQEMTPEFASELLSQVKQVKVDQSGVDND